MTKYLRRDLGLLLYAALKAFLPLPSLEIVLVPLCLNYPDSWFYFSLIGAFGTLIGALVGYLFAYYGGSFIYDKLSKNKEFENGSKLINKYGALAIFIGGITPIPDFLLAYLAGFLKMKLWLFLVSDSLARFLRSLIIGYLIATLGLIIDIDKWGTILSIFIFAYFFIKYFISLLKNKV